MFDEMVQLPRTAVDLLSGEHIPDTNWRGWYQLYLGLEEFIRAADSLLRLLENGPEALATGAPVARYVDICNDAFAALHQQFLVLLQNLFGLMRQGRRWPGAKGAQANLIAHHCHPKSYWMMCWDHVCSIGRLSGDGARLDRQVLRMHPAPANRMMESDMIEGQLYESASLDMSTTALRKEAATAARASLNSWLATERALRQILLERCTISDLVAK